MKKLVAALVVALALTGTTHAQKPAVKKPPVQKPTEKPAEQPKAEIKEKKVDEITDENIEVGVVGKLKGKLKVTDLLAFNNSQCIGSWGDMTVIIDNYPTEGLGKGKTLSPDLVWKVTEVIKGDTTGRGLKGSYTLACQNPPKK